MLFGALGGFAPLWSKTGVPVTRFKHRRLFSLPSPLRLQKEWTLPFLICSFHLTVIYVLCHTPSSSGFNVYFPFPCICVCACVRAFYLCVVNTRTCEIWDWCWELLPLFLHLTHWGRLSPSKPELLLSWETLGISQSPLRLEFHVGHHTGMQGVCMDPQVSTLRSSHSSRKLFTTQPAPQPALVILATIQYSLEGFQQTSSLPILVVISFFVCCLFLFVCYVLFSLSWAMQ